MSCERLPAPLTSALHNHCTLCDGKNTPAEMAAAALAAGFSGIGFSSHSAAVYPPHTGVGEGQIEAYLTALNELEREYNGRLRIYKGIELDAYNALSQTSLAKLDYSIAAVHDLYDARTDTFYYMDGGAPMLKQCIEELFGGDALAMVRHFYELSVQNAQKYRPDVVAHFDIVVKNNENGAFFDEDSPAYRALALEALHACADTGAVFEVNTGGMYRGYRSTPYPARFLLEALQKRGARVTVSADAHCTNALTYRFAQTLDLLRAVGFSRISVWENDGFTEKSL